METAETLKDWVRRHKVTFEVGTCQEVVEHELKTVGYELRVFGRHEPDTHEGLGCDACVRISARLEAIANAACPKDQSATSCEVETSSVRLYYRPESDFEPEVQLTAHIVHREDYLKPVDEHERRGSVEMQKALLSLGVQSKSWVERPGGEA